MKIAQIAPVIESVPPVTYGGTERVVSYLTEELVAQGHDVTLFASKDSRTRARLVATCDRATRLDETKPDPVFTYMCLLDEVATLADDFDVLHFHIDILHFPLFRQIAGKTVTTLHGRQDLPQLDPIYRRFAEYPLASISDSQRAPLSHGNFVRTIYHGLPADLLRANLAPAGGYLAFLGRVSPEKGLEQAIEIAQRSGHRLRIAAKVDRADEEYFHSVVEPLLGLPGIEFIGEIGDAQKSDFLGNADALLFPIDWPEPFGLVMIEAMACGTPVLAFRRGSVPEIIDDGVSGVIVDTVGEALRVLPKVLAMDRRGVRDRFEARFTAARMASDYVALYEDLLAARSPRHLPGVASSLVPLIPLSPASELAFDKP